MTVAPTPVHRARRRLLYGLFGVAALLVAVTVTVLVRETVVEKSLAPAGRSDLQRILDRLVASGDAPGVTAYVTGPRGTWLGSAGMADIETGAPMRPDARMRIESNSKTWLTAVILQLAQEGRLTLDDTVERWLPGLLREHGSRITIRQLMYDASGLIDDNDVFQATPAELRAYLARVGDAVLRAQLVAAGARLSANPAAEVSPLLFIRLAAWQPLVAAPGSTYHQLVLPPPLTTLDLRDAGISTVLFATGYRRAYPWLHVPVLDADGELVQRHGVTPVPGLYTLGFRFQRTRSSHFVGGVGEDAGLLAASLTGLANERIATDSLDPASDGVSAAWARRGGRPWCRPPARRGQAAGAPRAALAER